MLMDPSRFRDLTDQLPAAIHPHEPVSGTTATRGVHQRAGIRSGEEPVGGVCRIPNAFRNARWTPSEGQCTRIERLRHNRKSTRLNSSHLVISYAVFCLKKKMTVDRVLLHPRR